MPDSFTQKLNIEQLKGLNIRNIGPAGMSGRVTAIDVNLRNSDIIYIGTASGGVWKSPNGGITWDPIFDDQPVQSIGALAINQKNPSEIWVGTGEGNPRNSQNSGAGIFKSLDGGNSWQRIGLEETKTIHRIIIHRDNPDVVYVGAQGSAWGPNEERGIYRTKNGGKTWEKILYINDETGCADLVVDPTNPNKLIAAMWEYGRKPWTFNSGGPGSGIYVTHDGGDTWVKRTTKDGLPEGDLGRIGLAIAPSKPNIIYALVEAKKNALYKSMDGGFKWKKWTEDRAAGNRPFYYADIFVDPQNENRIYSLWSRISRSEDGGKNFEQYGNRRVHPDHHALWVNPNNPQHLLVGNDGGLNISRDGGENWRFVENLPLAQFYHINYDMDIPYNIGGGMQDNGSWVGPSAIWRGGGIQNQDWEEIYFGDGFDVVFHPDDSRYVYAMSQGGNLGYGDRITGKTQFVKPIHPEDVDLRFNWNAAIAQNPFHSCGIYYGSQFVHKSMDCGNTWEIISSDLTTNDPEKQKQNESGGLTIDDTQAENFTTILAIAPSPVDENVIWVGTDDGNLQLTRDGGASWVNLADKLTAARPGSWIPYIEVSIKNAGEVFVVVNDYRRNDWRPMVFHTTDFGQNFVRIVDEKQVEGHALSIVQDPELPELLWLGTDFGLYLSIDGGAHWNKWTNDFPAVSTADLKIHPREHDLIVGTFGRAAWILDDIRPIREIARTKGAVLSETFKVFPAPDVYLAKYRSYDGMHFPADAAFSGPNRMFGAMITFWVKPDSEGEETKEKEGKEQEKKKEKKKPEKIKVKIYDEANILVRTFSTSVDTGMNRISWNLYQDGVRRPSRTLPKPDADPPPFGPKVLPGTYKLVFHYGELKDSTSLKVYADPRLEVSLEELKAHAAVTKEYFAMVRKAASSFDQLMEAKKTIKRVDEALVNLPDSTKKEIATLGKHLRDSIQQLEELVMRPENLKGIQRRFKNLNATFSAVNRYIRNQEAAPNKTVEILMEKARNETAELLEKINQFLANDFADYQKQVEALEFSLFKAFEPVELE